MGPLFILFLIGAAACALAVVVLVLTAPMRDGALDLSRRKKALRRLCYAGFYLAMLGVIVNFWYTRSGNIERASCHFAVVGFGSEDEAAAMIERVVTVWEDHADGRSPIVFLDVTRTEGQTLVQARLLRDGSIPTYLDLALVPHTIWPDGVAAVHATVHAFFDVDTANAPDVALLRLYRLAAPLLADYPGLRLHAPRPPWAKAYFDAPPTQRAPAEPPD